MRAAIVGIIFFPIIIVFVRRDDFRNLNGLTRRRTFSLPRSWESTIPKWRHWRRFYARRIYAGCLAPITEAELVRALDGFVSYELIAMRLQHIVKSPATWRSAVRVQLRMVMSLRRLSLRNWACRRTL